MATKKTADYQVLSTELDEIMNKLQNDTVSVDEAVQAYERGMELLGELEVHLKETENKVQKIKASFDK